MLVFYTLQFLLWISCCSSVPSFTISYANNTFIRNGVSHRYVSGSMHYFRVPPEMWRDRMKKMRLAGLNTLQTYVEWSSHEPTPGEFVFSGGLDLAKYISTAQEVGLDVILRPGPFIDAERDFGGLPAWLLKNGDNIKLRTKDKKFMDRVSTWYKKLFTLLNKYLFENGGPIIMIQVENEYGSYGLQTGHCDKEYLAEMRDLIIANVGENVLLFSTDGAGSDMVMCGKVANVYSTVDFGCGANVKEAFSNQRLFEPNGPLVNSEYYPGWLDHWQNKHAKVDTKCVVNTLDAMLSLGASVNIYLFHGGTSFGFGAGSNNPPFAATPTSYDYDAPITEAGDLTDKFWAIRDTVGKYLTLPEIPEDLQNVTEKGNYGRIQMKFVSTMFDSKGMLSRTRNLSELPKTFEMLDQSYGFMIYETQISRLQTDPVILNVPGIRDRGTVFIDYRPVGILSRSEKFYSLPLQILPGQKLSLVVENQGRICYGPALADQKGIVGNVTLGGQVLKGWEMTGMPLENGARLEKYCAKVLTSTTKNMEMKKLLRENLGRSGGKMTFWAGEFLLGNSVGTAKDTFLSLAGWHKGVAFINGFNLGRYWPIVGPQKTLFVPRTILKPYPAKNSIILLEQDHAPCGHGDRSQELCVVELVDTADIDGDTPSGDKQEQSNKQEWNTW
eukprot:GFUD01026976.1.p1 GENE.GFUD01026976.1~~GFUD01026976.1.p1  ORF type:complete len:678 (+),score=151.84 GFUD01026976.1:30-2036(+)